MTESWVGKPKGMFDVAYERGLLNLNDYNHDEFIEKGTKNAQGLRIIQTLLKLLLSQCYDFMNEETMLQQTIKDLGACLERSPKYHCAIAGEGIEYCWGNAKMLYRRTPYSKRSTKQDFLKRITGTMFE